MKVADHICLAGYPAGEAAGKPYGKNEDWLAFRNESYVLLLDGSTGLGRQAVPQSDLYHSTAQWFVHRFAQLVEERIDSPIPLKELVFSCMQIAKSEYGQTLSALDCDLSRFSQDQLRLMQPSASMALVRKSGDKVELFSLGDLCILARTCDGVLHDLSGKSVQPLDRAVIQLAVQQAKEHEIGMLQAMKIPCVQEHLHANRLLKNSGAPNGYWILGFDAQALDHAITAQWVDRPLPADCDGANCIESLFICSDGFAALNDTYCQFSHDGTEDAHAFFQACLQRGLSPLGKTLREIEREDSDCNTYPRFKASDDAAAVVLHFQNHIPDCSK